MCRFLDTIRLLLCSAFTRWQCQLTTTTGALTTTAAKTPKFPSEVIDKTVEEIEKSLESMEDEAERIYRDEQLSLVEDEAAATCDMMYVQVEFVDGREN